MTQPDCIDDAKALLGEGPVWDDGQLYWVDIEGRAIHRWRDGHSARFTLPERVGHLAIRDSGGLVVGLQSGFHLVDLEPLSVRPLHDPEPELPNNRFNDGKCDQRGRLWAGTMDREERAPTGALYRLDPDHSVHRMDQGYVVTNGPAFSPDGGTMYHNDSARRTVYAFDCDPETGTISGKRVFVRLEHDAGFPDGMTVDRDGGIWLAHWDGWRVTRFTPDGAVNRVVEMPVARVTSCCFGGPDLRSLFITSARIGLSADQLAEQPMAGGLFRLELDLEGLPTERYGG